MANRTSDIPSNTASLYSGILAKISALTNTKKKSANRTDPKNGIKLDLSCLSPLTREYFEAHKDKMINWTQKNLLDMSNTNFPELEIAQRLRLLDTTKASVESMYNLVCNFIYPPGPLLKMLLFQFKDPSLPHNRLAVFYLFNHLVQTHSDLSWKHPIDFGTMVRTGLDVFLYPALQYATSIACEHINNYIKCIKIWQSRNVYSAKTCSYMLGILSKGGVNPSSVFIEAKGNGPGSESLIKLEKLSPLALMLSMPSVAAAQNSAIQALDAEGIDIDNLDDIDKGKDLSRIKALLKTSCGMIGQEIILSDSGLIELAGLIEDQSRSIETLENNIKRVDEMISQF